MNPMRFLPVRDKPGLHKRSTKTAEPGHQKPWTPGDAFLGIFKSDPAKQAAKDEVEHGKEVAKIEAVRQRLSELPPVNATVENVRDALASNFAEGNAPKAVPSLQLYTTAGKGLLLPYNPHIQMVGAENRGNVTCWLDSLLFAMFAKLSAFDCMLNADSSTDRNRQNLILNLRLWVNMLRSGKLIQVELTKSLQNSLASCGWPDAQRLEQQDASEAFGFITETLQLPLLSLRVDLFHHGKNDKDDHKVVYERLLNLAIPPDLGGKGLKLEDCLEEYLNARVDVLRVSQDDKKNTTETRYVASALSSESTIRIVTDTDDPEIRDLCPNAISPSGSLPDLPLDSVYPTDRASDATRPATIWHGPRNRTTSLIQNIVLKEKYWSDEGEKDTANSSHFHEARTGSKIVKAVTIPAWQFFRLIPWHAATNNEPQNDNEVAMNFKHRPVVGICLKRYTITNSGLPKRQNTFIDIPDSLRLPHFMLVNEEVYERPDGLNTEYKLVLQSIVCHRGESTQNGHYIAFARVAPKLLTDNRRQSYDPPPDYEEAQWVRFDDLQVHSRVTYVDDIKECLKHEMPYLLFYQILPMVDVTTEQPEDAPLTPLPSYDDANDVGTFPPTLLESKTLPRQPKTDCLDSTAPGTPQSQSGMRFSADFERPRWTVSGTEDTLARSLNTSRRASVNLAESIGDLSNTEPLSPAVVTGEESTAHRLSRAAQRLARTSKSRSSSQVAEGRVGFSRSRLGGLIRTSKDPFLDASHDAVEDHVKNGVDGEFVQKGHKRAKSRDKTKIKASPPERECTVM